MGRNNFCSFAQFFSYPSNCVLELVQDIWKQICLSVCQVHSLNILRALFRDTRLGEDVVPYIADGLKAAILGFKSQVWAVNFSG